jgi:hypothetical protein
MATTTYPIEQLRQIAADYRHMRGEHKREGEHGKTRRDIGSRLEEFEQRFQTLLDHWISDETAREAWREYLYRGGAVPADDLERHPPVFVGRSDTGSQLHVRAGSDGTYDVAIDGARADRAPPNLTFPAQGATRFLGREWKEITAAPTPALDALKTYCTNARGVPPWQWARALFADGLIDANFSLTSRGRRVVNTL